MPPILPIDVQNSLKKQLPRELKTDFNKEFKPKFEKIKQEMIKEFLSHPVTVEILSGPSASNLSGTLGGKANLFSFIGFDSSEEPIKPILEVLNSISYKDNGPSRKGIGRDFVINIPEAEEIFLITPMPWAAGRSWAKGIESGISGLGYLLNKSTASSRSGVAIQSSRKVRQGAFRNTTYISSLIKKYKKRFQDLS